MGVGWDINNTVMTKETFRFPIGWGRYETSDTDKRNSLEGKAELRADKVHAALDLAEPL